jgi:hypothetical protein
MPFILEKNKPPDAANISFFSPAAIMKGLNFLVDEIKQPWPWRFFLTQFLHFFLS